MFYKRFEERFALEKDADGSGAQLPGLEAVRQLHFFSHFILRGAVWPQHRALAVAGTQHPVQVTFTVATNRGRRKRGPQTSPENKQPPRKERPLWGKAQGNLLADQVSVQQDPKGIVSVPHGRSTLKRIYSNHVGAHF